MSHIMVWRGALPEDGLQGFWHHGIRCEDGSVIHYSGMDGMKTLLNGEIKRTGIREFAVDSDRQVHTVEYNSQRRVYCQEEIIQRAESRLGEKGYDLVRHNCENFARWCMVGDSTSFQVQGAWVGLALAAGTFVLTGGNGLLGAALTGLVGQRVWDAGKNVSRKRQGFNIDRATRLASSREQNDVLNNRSLVDGNSSSRGGGAGASSSSSGVASGDDRRRRNIISEFDSEEE